MSNVLARVILFTIAGFLAGLFTSFIADFSGFVRLSDTVGKLSPTETRGYYIVFMTWGASISLALGLADTMLSGAWGEWKKVLGLGLIVGIVSGVIGGTVGMAIYEPLYVFPTRTGIDFLRNIVARAAGWAFIGGLAGTASGWRKLSMRVGRNGFIGGIIGGILGGAVFETIPYLMPGIRPGPTARLFAFAITGAMIGLFVALVQELLKEAWLRLVVGRNEGKEFLVEKEMTRIGRSELSDVPLFGDTTVAKNHAVLVALSGSRFAIRDTGESPAGVLVNEQRISGEHPVRNGDRIQVGGKLLVFYERFTRTRTVAEPRDVAAPRPTVPSGLPSLSDLPTVSGRIEMPMPGGISASPNGGVPYPSAVAPSSITGPRFVAVAGPHAGMAFAATPGAIIGRDPNVGIPLAADTKASRNHARLIADAGGVGIEDMGSTNGTYVNGKRITRQALLPGDTVVIGGTHLRFE
jgi:pSer/pThr/pTyr-binding forkhead associated (FHA) protein